MGAVPGANKRSFMASFSEVVHARLLLIGHIELTLTSDYCAFWDAGHLQYSLHSHNWPKVHPQR